MPETGRLQATNQTNLETQEQTEWIEMHQSQVNVCFLKGPLRWLTEQKNPKFLWSLQNAQRDATNLAIRTKLRHRQSHKLTWAPATSRRSLVEFEMIGDRVATFLECSLNFQSASYLDIQRMLSGRMTSDFALQRDKDERNGIYSSPKKVISDAILICLVWGACMAQIVLKIAYTFDDWYRWNHAAPSLKKGTSCGLLHWPSLLILYIEVIPVWSVLCVIVGTGFKYTLSKDEYSNISFHSKVFTRRSTAAYLRTGTMAIRLKIVEI